MINHLITAERERRGDWGETNKKKHLICNQQIMYVGLLNYGMRHKWPYPKYAPVIVGFLKRTKSKVLQHGKV